nr:aldose 1-epimerase [Polaribacter porphyrae]
MNFIILQNEAKTTQAKISLNQGASLQELRFNTVDVIKNQPEFSYKDSYASSILFPFASRIQNGAYSFLGEDYQLKKNDDDVNALHGLVYDKFFEFFEPEVHQNNCSATFNYFEKDKSVGFPFKYFISLTYTLYEDRLQLRATVKNMENLPFPFIIGWHPYFLSSDIQNSFLEFNSDKKVVFDENLITKEIINQEQKGKFKIADKQLDDCFFLENDIVAFSTPDYNINIKSSAKENFLQLYTPKNQPIIAIEPMTGISNSFNNKVGLQVLEPQETYAVTWDVTFNQTN